MAKGFSRRATDNYQHAHARGRVYTDQNVKRLRNLAERRGHDLSTQVQFQRLADALEVGTILLTDRVPCEVVTMDSRVVLHSEASGDEVTVTLVYPGKAALNAGRLSVLTSLGTAILGRHVGDTVRYRTPSGERHIRIDRIVHQPEGMPTVLR